MRLLVKVSFGVIVILACSLWLFTLPESRVSRGDLETLVPNVSNGQQVFYIAGCASCHISPSDDEPNQYLLGGGKHFVTAFGVFIAPNISPDKVAGIGAWSTADFATALLKGLSPDNQHYFPAFPYTTYTRMTLQDIVDLKGFMDTLPLSNNLNKPHQLYFPFSIRRGLGLWKRLYLSDRLAINFNSPTVLQRRGQYLVEALGHCGECHSPRTLLGGIQFRQWLSGASAPDGQSRVPDISILSEWTVEDIAEYLSSGFTPDYDVAGGLMGEVIDNTRQLSSKDRKAIAEYLKAINANAKP